MHKVRDHLGKVMNRHNKEQERQPAGRTKYRFPRGRRRRPGWGIGGSGPHGVSDSDMRPTFPRCPVPLLREGRVRFHDLVVSHTPTSLGFWAMTSLGAAGSNLLSPHLIPKDTHACFCRLRMYIAEINTLIPTSREGQCKVTLEGLRLLCAWWYPKVLCKVRKSGCRTAWSLCFCVCIKVAIHICLHA